MKSGFSWQDHAIRAGILAGGVIAAVLFVLKGSPEALPALAIGGSLGAWLVRKHEEPE